MGMRMAGIAAEGKVHHGPPLLPWEKHQPPVWRSTADPRAHDQGMYPLREPVRDILQEDDEELPLPDWVHQRA